MIKFTLPGSDQILTLSTEVLEHFHENRQTGLRNERGGQLFAKLDYPNIKVVLATGPKKKDRSGRFFFHPNRLIEKMEIRRLYKENLHFVGDWHTHPQKVPTPSGIDISSMNDCFKKSKHDLGGFLLVVVGTEPIPTGLYVSVHHHSGRAVLLHRD